MQSSDMYGGTVGEAGHEQDASTNLSNGINGNENAPGTCNTNVGSSNTEEPLGPGSAALRPGDTADGVSAGSGGVTNTKSAENIFYQSLLSSNISPFQGNNDLSCNIVNSDGTAPPAGNVNMLSGNADDPHVHSESGTDQTYRGIAASVESSQSWAGGRTIESLITHLFNHDRTANGVNDNSLASHVNGSRSGEVMLVMMMKILSNMADTSLL